MGVMNDERFEAQINEAMRDYHRPPETPRDEIWAAIEAERRRRRNAPRIVVLKPFWRWGIGMAAVLVLGIAIGRRLQPGTGGTRAPSVVTSSSQGEGVAYQLAAAQVLTRAEIVLTSFRADARTGGRPDLQFLDQARDLLGSTRLLLDSPAGRDPQLRPLLEDLEVILAQIAVLSASRDTVDMQIINQGIDQRSVLSRLQTANPAGLAPGHAQGAI
jgi:hypothetical protein